MNKSMRTNLLLQSEYNDYLLRTHTASIHAKASKLLAKIT